MTIALNDSHSGQRGGAQTMNAVNESGLYSLVLVPANLKQKHSSGRQHMMSFCSHFQKLIGNEPWFVAVDVCRALDIVNTARALSGLDADEKGVHSMNTLGGEQKVSIINEPGLYSLILRSRKPEAKAFKRKVTKRMLIV